jgi:hypothetical protein
MALFRPVNSSESNLFTIRLSIGSGSSLGVFNTGSNSIGNNDVLASNNTTYPITKNHLASPTLNNLPKDFYLKYVVDSTNYSYQVIYGKTFTQQPTVQVIPHTGVGTYAGIPSIVKNSLTSSDYNLAIHFVNSSGTSIAPSSDGSTGLLGFDLIITGPVKIGITTGNSNKGWALNDSTGVEPTNVFTYLDVNLGGSYTQSDSIIVSKNLKYLSADGTIKQYTATTSTLDYKNTIWLIDGGVTLTTLTPQIGMLLIISSTDTGYDTGTSSYTSNPVVQIDTGLSINYQTSLTTIEFSQRGSSIILYGTSITNFIVLSQTTNVTLS